MKKWLSWEALWLAFILVSFFSLGLQFERYFSTHDEDQVTIINLTESREKLQGTILYLSQQLYETDEFIFSECAGEQKVIFYKATSQLKRNRESSK